MENGTKESCLEGFYEDYSSTRVLRRETIGCAVIDTGCNVNVCGLNWLNEYEEMMDETDKRLVKEQKSNKYFRFGDGKSVKARKKR